MSEPDGCTLWIDGWWRACCDVHDMAFISGSVDLDTHLERAARFLYLQRLAFGGKIVGRSFGVDRCGPGRFDVRKLGPMLEGIHERMAGVVIENLDFEAFIRRYDRHGALFFLDPPYWGNEGDYGKDLFARADFERLTRCLRDIKGRFILTLNDRPETRSLFAGMAIDAVGVTYSVGDRNDHQAREIIVSTPG